MPKYKPPLNPLIPEKICKAIRAIGFTAWYRIIPRTEDYILISDCNPETLSIFTKDEGAKIRWTDERYFEGKRFFIVRIEQAH